MNFSSAAVTYLVGLAASLPFAAPGPAQQALVYGSGYKHLPPGPPASGSEA